VPGQGPSSSSTSHFSSEFQRSILLVDDEATFAIHLAASAAPRLDRIFEARNGVEAIEVYKKDSPDLVMLDVNMPVMDGSRPCGR